VAAGQGRVQEDARDEESDSAGGLVQLIVTEAPADIVGWRGTRWARRGGASGLHSVEVFTKPSASPTLLLFVSLLLVSVLTPTPSEAMSGAVVSVSWRPTDRMFRPRGAPPNWRRTAPIFRVAASRFFVRTGLTWLGGHAC